MTVQQEFRDSADRLDRMALKLDVDLESRLFNGDLPAGLIPDMVLRCAACPNPGHCDVWCNEGSRDAPPDYCRNKTVLTRLRARASTGSEHA